MAGAAKHATGQMDPDSLDQSGKEAEIPSPSNADQVR